MLSWGVIGYGAALSAIVAVLLVLVAHQRQPATIVCVALGALAGPVAWNAILRATHANEFFTDAPILVFPISWQDTGSGVLTLATTTALLALGPMRSEPARKVTLIAALAALAALLVDVYLY